MRLATVLVALIALSPVASASAVVTYGTEPSGTQVPNGRVYAITRDAAGGTIIGGTFTRVKNPVTGTWVNRARLARFAADGSLDPDWNPGADGTVRALTVSDTGVLYVGGDFTTVGGITAPRLAALSPSGAAVPDFSATPSGSVRDLAVVDGGLYVAGNFGTVSRAGTSFNRVGVAKLDPGSGAVFTSWNARVGMGRVVALAPDLERGQLVIGGNFKKVAGADVLFLAAVNLADGKRNLSWNPPRICDTCNLLDVTVGDGKVFGAAAGGGGGRAAAWSLTEAASSRLWIRPADGDVQAVDYRDGIVYFGGHFAGDFYGYDRHQLAAVDAEGTVLDFRVPFTGLDDPGIWAILAEEDGLYIGGGFQGIYGSKAARYGVFSAASEVSPTDTP